MKTLLRCVCIAIISSIICISFTGCWNYKQLDELAIVAGIAIDRAEEGNGYKVSFEIIDFTQSISENTISTEIVNSEGNTIFEAFSNTKNKLIKDLYFANMQLICISEQIVKEESLFNMVDGFLRDPDIRESICIIISKEENAEKIISPGAESSKVMSYEINNVIDDTNRETTSARKIGVYKAYNDIKEGEAIALPAFAIKDDQPVLDGISLFDKEKFVGFLSQDDIVFYQFSVNNVKTGIFSFPLMEEGVFDSSIQITDNNTKLSYEKKEDGSLILNVDIKTEAYVKEILLPFDMVNEQNRKFFKKRYAEYVSKSVYNFIDKIRSEYGLDILGFNDLIYRAERQYWEQIEGKWTDMLRNAELKVNVDLDLTSSGFIK